MNKYNLMNKILMEEGTCERAVKEEIEKMIFKLFGRSK